MHYRGLWLYFEIGITDCCQRQWLKWKIFDLTQYHNFFFLYINIISVLKLICGVAAVCWRLYVLAFKMVTFFLSSSNSYFLSSSYFRSISILPYKISSGKVQEIFAEKLCLLLWIKPVADMTVPAADSWQVWVYPRFYTRPVHWRADG